MKINKNVVFSMTLTGAFYVFAYLIGLHIEILWLGVVFLVCYPYKIGDHVYSLFGGFSDNNIYSLFGIYQNAGGNAEQLVGLTFYRSFKTQEDHWSSIIVASKQK